MTQPKTATAQTKEATNLIAKAADSATASLAKAADSATASLAKAADSATAAIAHSAELATKVISDAAETAAKVVSTAAIERSKLVNVKIQDDHDLLIRIETRMEGLKSDIKELKDGTAKRIDTLEIDKLDIKDSYTTIYRKEVEAKQEDFEARIRSNEKNIIRILTFGTFIIIAIGVIEFLINTYVHITH